MSTDIHALEINFAKSPTLDACIPLCRAYLANRRYMEAMVVCKKGMKSAPHDPRGRAMLTRVYLEQGKLPKAHQELQDLILNFPNHPLTIAMQGRVLMAQGQYAQAVAQLQASLASDPTLEEARQWLQELGVAVGPAPIPAAGAPDAVAPVPGVPGQMPAGTPAYPAPPAGTPQAPMGGAGPAGGVPTAPGAAMPGGIPGGMPAVPPGGLGTPGGAAGATTAGTSPGTPIPNFGADTTAPGTAAGAPASTAASAGGIGPGAQSHPYAPPPPAATAPAPVATPAGFPAVPSPPAAPASNPDLTQPGVPNPFVGGGTVAPQGGAGAPFAAPAPAAGQPPPSSAVAPAGTPVPPTAPMPGQDLAPPVPVGAPTPVAAEPAADTDTSASTPAAGSTPSTDERVEDFFATDSLGFADDGSHIETAGPGRLTILGFVPKNTGSLKTTLLVALSVLALLAGAVTWSVVSSQATREINAVFGDIREALSQDRYERYNYVLQLSEEIFAIAPDHNLTLSAAAYAHAVLAVEHGQEDSLEEAETRLTQALENESLEAVNEFKVAAQGLVGYAKGELEETIQAIQALQAQNVSHPLIELEAFRLLNAVDANDKGTKKQFRRLVTTASGTRVFNNLGWHYYRSEDWTNADKYFGQALQLTKNNETALVGQALADLGRGIGLKERQKEIEERLKKVFALPKDEVSSSTLAAAHFARGLLLQWRKKTSDANKEFAAMRKLGAPGFFEFHLGTSLLKQGNAKEAVARLLAATEAEPKNYHYLLRLADAQRKAKLFSEAAKTLETAADLKPQAASLRLAKADAAFGQKKHRDAIRLYQAIGPRDGGIAYTRAMLGLSRAYRAVKDHGKAVKTVEQLLEKMPSSAQGTLEAETWCELGLGYEALAKFTKAAKSYRTGIEQYPHYPDCHYFLCRTLGNGKRSKDACRQYLELAPNGGYAADARRRTAK